MLKAIMDRHHNLVEAFMDYIGRRGLVLLIFSIVFGLVGFKTILDPSVDQGHFMLYSFLPAGWRTALWLLPSLLGLLAALHRTRRDGIGFTALSVPAVLLCTSYWLSWIGHLFGVTEWSLGWVYGAQWLLILTVLMVVAGWPEVSNRIETDGPQLRNQRVLVVSESKEVPHDGTS